MNELDKLLEKLVETSIQKFREVETSIQKFREVETSIQKFRESEIYNVLKMQAEGCDEEFVDSWLESMEIAYAKGCADSLMGLSSNLLNSPQNFFNNYINNLVKCREEMNERN